MVKWYKNLSPKKKFLWAFSVLGVIGFFLWIGNYCYPRWMLLHTVENLKEVNSVSINGTANVSISTKLKLKGTANMTRNTSKLDVTYPLFGIPVSNQIYIQTGEKKVSIYYGMQGINLWNKTDIEKTSGENSSLSYSDISYEILSYQKDSAHVCFLIDGDLQAFLSKYGLQVLNSSKIEVWIKQGYVVRLKMDSGRVSFKHYPEIQIDGFDLNLSQYNQSSTVEIPEDILKSTGNV